MLVQATFTAGPAGAFEAAWAKSVACSRLYGRLISVTTTTMGSSPVRTVIFDVHPCDIRECVAALEDCRYTVTVFRDGVEPIRRRVQTCALVPHHTGCEVPLRSEQPVNFGLVPRAASGYIGQVGPKGS
jgi:hypothetical protein